MSDKKKENFEILGIDHLGIAPKQADVLEEFFKNILNLPFIRQEDVTSQKTKTVVYQSHQSSHRNELFNDPKFEILSPLNQDPESPIAKFLSTKGSGIHHMALRVKNIEAILKHLIEKNIKLIDSTPRIGEHHSKIAFIHPHATGGILIELVERN